MAEPDVATRAAPASQLVETLHFYSIQRSASCAMGWHAAHLLADDLPCVAALRGGQLVLEVLLLSRAQDGAVRILRNRSTRSHKNEFYWETGAQNGAVCS